MRRITLPLLISLCSALPAHADEAELRAKVEKLSAEDNGKIYQWNGQELPW